MSGAHAAYRTPNRPEGTNPDGTAHHVLDYTPQLQRVSKHRGGRTPAWNATTRARIDRYVRKLIQARKTEVEMRKLDV